MDRRSRGSPSFLPNLNAFRTIADETGPQKILLSWLMKWLLSGKKSVLWEEREIRFVLSPDGIDTLTAAFGTIGS